MFPAIAWEQRSVQHVPDMQPAAFTTRSQLLTDQCCMQIVGHVTKPWTAMAQADDRCQMYCKFASGITKAQDYSISYTQPTRSADNMPETCVIIDIQHCVSSTWAAWPFCFGPACNTTAFEDLMTGLLAKIVKQTCEERHERTSSGLPNRILEFSYIKLQSGS